jgi:hypothetical protein
MRCLLLRLAIKGAATEQTEEWNAKKRLLTHQIIYRQVKHLRPWLNLGFRQWELFQNFYGPG